MRSRRIALSGWIVFLVVGQTGCASFNRKLKALLNGSPSESSPQTKTALTTFSQTTEMPPRVRREYRRTTKETLSQESALEAGAGSLWVMEGQGAYLFSQNIMRLVGDPLAVTLEGDPKDQLNSKVSVIRKLLTKIEERQKARMRHPAAGEEADANKDKKEKESDKKDATASNSQEKSEPAAASEDFGVKTVPTRIVERTLEGNYRVKGSQPFMIGSREYKVIVTGIVRAEDFNDEGIPASKLLDPKFDIVSARRDKEEM
ncbi:MAG: flagellar basal body L-ring protein FlgH [Bdellovibrionales bacterium]